MLSSLGKLGCKWAFLGEFSMIRITNQCDLELFASRVQKKCIFCLVLFCFGIVLVLILWNEPLKTLYLCIFHYSSVHCSIAQNPLYAYNCYDAVHSCNASSNLHHTASYQKESSNYLPYQKSFRNLNLHFRKNTFKKTCQNDIVQKQTITFVESYITNIFISFPFSR